MALAAGGVAAVAATSGRVLVAASRDGAATALAAERIERLRAGPRLGGSDLILGPEGTTWVRRWGVDGGRGRPDALDATIEWPSHVVGLSTAALP